VEIVGDELTDDAGQIEAQVEVISSSSVGASTASARMRVSH
jgi:hypothetical protein